MDACSVLAGSGDSLVSPGEGHDTCTTPNLHRYYHLLQQLTRKVAHVNLPSAVYRCASRDCAGNTASSGVRGDVNVVHPRREMGIILDDAGSPDVCPSICTAYYFRI